MQDSYEKASYMCPEVEVEAMEGCEDTPEQLSGERSFSTLCFALALHQMIKSPFRAIDEFDVFMDAVSRKISLDTLVDLRYHMDHSGCSSPVMIS
uniref:Uncharacterized protein n=1 Tax=Chenopodium quinoa TaxID=63459 RepID=A0A803N9M2_CHEQI